MLKSSTYVQDVLFHDYNNNNNSNNNYIALFKNKLQSALQRHINRKNTNK